MNWTLRGRPSEPRGKAQALSGLAPAGEARANAYVDYFKNFTLDSKPIHFDYLFAAKDSHESKRPKLTIKPLSKVLGLDVNTDFKEQDYASLADELRSGPYSNKNILVCWHHGKIPELLASLGADPQKLLPPKGKWPEDVFGWFVRLEYDQNGNLNVKVQDEDLMPGDAANPPPQVKASPLSKPCPWENELKRETELTRLEPTSSA